MRLTHNQEDTLGTIREVVHILEAHSEVVGSLGRTFGGDEVFEVRVRDDVVLRIGIRDGGAARIISEATG